MNICLITQEYPPETNWGGIATYTEILARRLVDLGQRVHVVSMTTQEEYRVDDGLLSVHRVNRVPHSRWVYLFNNRYFQFHPYLNFSFRVAEKVKEIHHQESIDVLESPETCAQAVTLALTHKTIPVITRLHTPHFWVRRLNGIGSTLPFYRRDFLEKLQTRCSVRISSPTRAMADVVKKKWGVRQIDVIPNFFDGDDYIPDRSVFQKYLDGSDYILFFGRLEVRKGPHILSLAVPNILRAFQNLKIVFAGADFPYGSTTMRQHILEENKDSVEHLVFLDNMPRNQLYPIIENAKLVVLPSLWENFPYACLEAMSFGKAVIATRGSGFEEIIEDGLSGILIPPNSPDALTEAVIEILRRTNVDSVGREARERVSEFHSLRVVPEILKYYSRAIGKDK